MIRASSVADALKLRQNQGFALRWSTKNDWSSGKDLPSIWYSRKLRESQAHDCDSASRWLSPEEYRRNRRYLAFFMLISDAWRNFHSSHPKRNFRP